MSLKTFHPYLAEIAGEELRFLSGSLREAIDNGCFALAIPDDLDLAPGIRLANEFHLAPEDEPSQQGAGYRGFRLREGIYFDRDHYQTEHILIDEPRRRVEFPDPANAMCERMYLIGRIVLRTILSAVGIPSSLWERATDYCVTNGGVQWFAVSHYRSGRNAPGAPEHKDTGFVTVLYYEQPGLEAFIDNNWCDVPPVPGHFLINFGGALEALTARLPDRVRAVRHRVRQCGPGSGSQCDRFSFAAFLNPSATSEAFEIADDGGSLVSLGSVDTFLRDFNRTTWRDGYAEFGITKRP
ncbi:2OG-Fe(II) oxygenase family protein [Burkholderia gladioli]|uniref:2OG-Fe(II) oxygenase family protein n=1 Tax=Burkholderia gladioli TaxID=28095 RepID=UPI0016420E03|nr:2OG-Fe(II) oxygenase family protein [Burkholderia gladioli]